MDELEPDSYLEESQTTDDAEQPMSRTGKKKMAKKRKNSGKSLSLQPTTYLEKTKFDEVSLDRRPLKKPRALNKPQIKDANISTSCSSCGAHIEHQYFHRELLADKMCLLNEESNMSLSSNKNILKQKNVPFEFHERCEACRSSADNNHHLEESFEFSDPLKEEIESLDDKDSCKFSEEESESGNKNDLSFEIKLEVTDAEYYELMVEETSKKPPSQSQRKLKFEENKKKNSGESYQTSTGKIVKPREMKPLPDCRRKCKEQFTESQRLKLFKNYWSLRDYKKRKIYISNLITLKLKKRAQLVTVRTRNYSYDYRVVVDKLPIVVCKVCFKTLFSETISFINDVCVKKATQQSEMIGNDRRGGFRRELSEQRKKEVEEHVDSFATYLPRYCASNNNNRRYLPRKLTTMKMHNLYKSKYLQSNLVSLSAYSKVVKRKNLRFQQLEKDCTCKKCDYFKARIFRAKTAEEKHIFEADRDQHQQIAADANTEMEKDKQNLDLTVFCFSLQRCLPTPYLFMESFKRKLWTFNLTIRNCSNDKTTCYIWDETIAETGSQEIASCLYHYITHETLQTSKIILFSTNCAGQAKNFNMSAMFNKLLLNKTEITSIEHKFLETGHSQTECTTDQAKIESQMKKSSLDISHPHDWRQLARICHFTVVSMTSELFFNFAVYNKMNFAQKFVGCETKEEIPWSDVRSVLYKTNEFGIAYVKKRMSPTDVDYTKVESKKRLWKMSNRFKPLKVLHSKPLPISVNKHKDLLDLVSFVDPIFRPFYEGLSVDESLPDTNPDIDVYYSDDEEDYQPDFAAVMLNDC